MQAFTDTPISHADFVAEMRAHRDADRFLQGTYWNGSRGCAVGCGLETLMRATGRKVAGHRNHELYAQLTGIPVELIHVQDVIFEQLPVEAAREWPVNFSSAIRPGADLSDVWRRFAVRMLREIVLPVAGEYASVVKRVADGYEAGWIESEARIAAVTANGQNNAVSLNDPAYLATGAAYLVAYSSISGHRDASGSAASMAGQTAPDAFPRLAAMLLEEIARA